LTGQSPQRAVVSMEEEEDPHYAAFWSSGHLNYIADPNTLCDILSYNILTTFDVATCRSPNMIRVKKSQVMRRAQQVVRAGKTRGACIQEFCGKTRSERDHLEDLSICGLD
jgi:hypothetical protein